MSLSGLYSKIYLDIINDRVQLPSMPEIVVRLRDILSKDDYTTINLARVVQADIGLSTYLINISNSPVYRTRVKATNVESAIRMMGISAFSNIINTYALKSLTDTGALKNKTLIREFWKLSAYRAAISAALSRQLKGIDENRALLSGLIQEVGVLPVLMKLKEDQFEGLPLDQAISDLQEYSTKIGTLIARKWNFDDELLTVIENAGNYAYPGSNQVDLVDIANMSRLLSQIGSKNIQWPDIDQAPCLNRFNQLGLNYENILQLLKEAKEDIQAIRQVLLGSLK